MGYGWEAEYENYIYDGAPKDKIRLVSEIKDQLVRYLDAQRELNLIGSTRSYKKETVKRKRQNAQDNLARILEFNQGKLPSLGVVHHARRIILEYLSP